MSQVSEDVSTDAFYWGSRLIGALADPHFGSCVQLIERYQMAVASKGHKLINDYDEKMLKNKKYDLIEQANEAICEMAKKETIDTLGKVLLDASIHMKCSYNRTDN